MIGLASVRADAAYLSGRSYASGGYREFKKTLDTSQQARIQASYLKTKLKLTRTVGLRDRGLKNTYMHHHCVHSLLRRPLLPDHSL